MLKQKSIFLAPFRVIGTLNMAFWLAIHEHKVGLGWLGSPVLSQDDKAIPQALTGLGLAW
jgi:hypothetical protein